MADDDRWSFEDDERDTQVRRRPGRGHRGTLAGLLGAARHLRDAEPDGGSGGRQRPGGPAQKVHHGHVPVPLGRGPACRPPAGLHRHGRLRPLPADERAQRAAHPGLRRLRAARRAVRGADRHAPAGVDRGQYEDVPDPAAPPGPGLRPAAFVRHHRSGLLPVDAVDLRPDLQLLVRPRRGPGAADRGAGGAVRRGRAGHPRRQALGRADRGGARGRAERPPPGLRLGRAGELVPRPGHGAGERGGHRGRPFRAGQLPRVQGQAAPVEHADHRLRGPADRRPGHGRLAGGHQAPAAELDRPFRRRPAGLPAGAGERRDR